MSAKKYLTPEEVSERYRGEISIGTLRNWRTQGIGFSFVKIGKAVLYPVEGLDAWDEAHTVVCRAPRRRTEDITQQNDREDAC
jgi:Helix-turn-helix domain